MTDEKITEERVCFRAEEDECEGVLAYPTAAEAGSAAVFLAPHPVMGGNMDNNVIRHLARQAAADGILTLRFNYRGVDGSGLALPPGLSRYDYFSQMEDSKDYQRLLPETFAAVKFIQQAAPGASEYILAGYSLGALLCGWITPEAGIARVFCISPPNTRASMEAFQDLTLPKIFLGGDKDPFFHREAFLRDLARWPEPKTFIPFPNADHFFRGEEERLYQSLQPHLAGQSAEP
jgi:alpha/beta superfamily hydrolase